MSLDDEVEEVLEVVVGGLDLDELPAEPLVIMLRGCFRGGMVAGSRVEVRDQEPGSKPG